MQRTEPVCRNRTGAGPRRVPATTQRCSPRPQAPKVVYPSSGEPSLVMVVYNPHPFSDGDVEPPLLPSSSLSLLARLQVPVAHMNETWSRCGLEHFSHRPSVSLGCGIWAPVTGQTKTRLLTASWGWKHDWHVCWGLREGLSMRYPVFGHM